MKNRAKPSEGLLPFLSNKNKMSKLEMLADHQAEVVTGGWLFPSLTNKTSTLEINNLISQSNVGSAWASGATASGGNGWGWLRKPSQGAETETKAKNVQKNYLDLNNFGFNITI
jgi:hypothetical protein